MLNKKISYAFVGVFLSFLALFYAAVISPRLNYFNKVTVDVVRLGVHAEDVNSLCQKPHQEIALFVQNTLLPITLERREILMKMISEAPLQQKIISDKSYKVVRDFARWHNEQILEVMLSEQCPIDLKNHDELKAMEESVVASFPKNAWDAVKQMMFGKID